MKRLAPLLLALLPGLVRAADAPPAPHRLSNGLEVYVIEKRTVPLVTIEVAVKAGSFVEEAATNGLSHLYEHMFFKGNGALPNQEAYMKRVAELGISFNGTTGTERVNYFVTLPSRNFGAGMKFMSDALMSPLFDAEEMKKERLVVLGEYDRNEASPAYHLRRAMQNALYGSDAVRKNPLGERDIILSATRAIMEGFKEKLYIPNNAALVIAGDVNRTEALALAEEWFGERLWHAGEDPHQPPRPPIARLQKTKAVLVTRPRAPLALAAAFNGPDVGRDARATFVADVWGTLCGQRQGRFQRAFLEAGVAPGAQFSYHTQREGGEINFQAPILGDRVLAARDLFLREIAAMADPGYFTEEDLELAKRSLHVSRAFEAESTGDAAHNLTFWWASAGIDYYASYLSAIDTVTREEVASFARAYLVGRPMILGCLASEAQAQQMGLTEAALLPPASVSGGAAEVTAFALSNGVRVIARREEGAQVGALELLVRGGSAELTEETQGAELMALGVALEASKELDRAALQRTLEALGARFGADANYDFSRAGVAAPAENLAEAVEVFAACLRAPAIDAASLAERRAAMKTRLESERSNADNYLARVTNRAFFANHAYRFRPDGALETVDKLERPVLEAALRAALRSGRVVIAVVSPLPQAETKALLERSFAWIPKDPSPAKTAGAFSPEGRIVFEQRAEIPTTYVLAKMAMPGPEASDYTATRVLMTILSNKLWDAIRTKNALSYAPSAGLASYHANYGVLYVSTTDPGRCLDLMREEIAKLQQAPLDAAEVTGAVSLMTTRALQQIEPASAHAAALGAAEIVRGRWERLYTEPVEFESVTPAAVRDAARAHLKGFVLGVIGKETVDPGRLAAAGQ